MSETVRLQAGSSIGEGSPTLPPTLPPTDSISEEKDDPSKEADDRTPLPFWPMLAVCGTQLCEAVQITMIFPMLIFLIEELGIAEDPSDVGFYAGLLGATFCTGQVCTAAMWGSLSDRFGRRSTHKTAGFVHGLRRACLTGIYWSLAWPGRVSECSSLARPTTTGKLSVTWTYMLR